MLKLNLKLSFFLLSGLLILGGELLTPRKVLAANSPFAGVYMGIIFGTCGPGEFALLVKNDNTMMVMFYETDLEKSTFVVDVAISPDGTFVFPVAGTPTSIRGTLTATEVRGSFSNNVSPSCPGEFTGFKQPNTGPLANDGGYYSGSLEGTAIETNSGFGNPVAAISGTIHFIIAANGNTFALAFAHGVFIGNFETFEFGGFLDTSSSGQISGTTTDGTVISGQINSLDHTATGEFSGDLIFGANRTADHSGTWDATRRFRLPNEWTMVGVGDFNNDGTSNILWRNDDGSVAIWQMNNLQFAAGADLGVVPNEWEVQ